MHSHGRFQSVFFRKKPADPASLSKVITVHGMQTRSVLNIWDEQNQHLDIYLKHDPAKQYPSGHMGMIKKGITVDKQEYAVKIYGRDPKLTKQQEGDRISLHYERYKGCAEHALKANQLLRKEAFYLIRGSKIYLITPWISGETLDDESGQMNSNFLAFPVEKRYRMGLDLLGAVNKLHKKKRIHGDLKPSNIMHTSDGDIYLIDLDTVRAPYTSGDYALSLDYLDENLYTKCRHRFPEVISSLDILSDIYALGVVLIAMLPECGSYRVPPFCGSFNPKSRIKKNVYMQLEDSKIPTEFKRKIDNLRYLMRMMLSENPSDRPTIPSIFRYLKKMEERYHQLLEEADHNRDAAYDLGCLFHEGKFFSCDFVQAEGYFRKAMVQGHFPAISKLALIYQQGGYGITQNIPLAAHYHRIAAEHKVPSANHDLLSLHLTFPNNPYVIYHAAMILKSPDLSVAFNAIAWNNPNNIFDELSEHDSFDKIKSLLTPTVRKGLYQWKHMQVVQQQYPLYNRIPLKIRCHILTFLVHESYLAGLDRKVKRFDAHTQTIKTEFQEIKNSPARIDPPKGVSHLLLSWFARPFARPETKKYPEENKQNKSALVPFKL